MTKLNCWSIKGDLVLKPPPQILQNLKKIGHNPPLSLTLGSLSLYTHKTHIFNQNLKKTKENLGGSTLQLGKLSLSLDWYGLDIEK